MIIFKGDRATNIHISEEPPTILLTGMLGISTNRGPRFFAGGGSDSTIDKSSKAEEFLISEAVNAHIKGHNRIDTAGKSVQCGGSGKTISRDSIELTSGKRRGVVLHSTCPGPIDKRGGDCGQRIVYVPQSSSIFNPHPHYWRVVEHKKKK